MSALTAAEFAALMRPFAPFGARLAVAVSGGPDSMALAWCARQWAQDQGVDLVALIVDHALRPESSAEVALVRDRLQALGLKSEILRWDHAPVTAKLHAAARAARYDLLLDACRRHGIHDLVLAHHRDDQAETVLMRLAKGSGIDGLAGMAAVTVKDGMRLLRPFLALPKSRLIATCQTKEIPFVTDPSNESERFARGRLRRVLPLLEAEGLSAERLCDLAARAADAKEALDHVTRQFLNAHTTRDDAGVIGIDKPALMAQPREIVLRALTTSLRHIHRGEHSPERAALLSLWHDIQTTEPLPARTLHGCLIAGTERHVMVMREIGAITVAPAIRPGETLRWDGRWTVMLDQTLSATDLTVRPLGHPPHETLDRLAPDLRHKIPQGRARAALPALWRNETLIAAPTFNAAGQVAGQLKIALARGWPE
jgi:tRNA(Ile)-lysidine synthase